MGLLHSKALPRIYTCDIASAESRTEAIRILQTRDRHYDGVSFDGKADSPAKERMLGSVGDDMVTAIEQLLISNRVHTYLKFWYVNLSDVSAEKLARVLEKNSTLEVLMWGSFVKPSQRTAELLSYGVHVNTSLQAISVDGITNGPVPAKDFPKLGRVLYMRTKRKLSWKIVVIYLLIATLIFFFMFGIYVLTRNAILPGLLLVFCLACMYLLRQ